MVQNNQSQSLQEKEDIKAGRVDWSVNLKQSGIRDKDVYSQRQR